MLESIVSNRELQFAAEIMKELNKMLGIDTKLSTLYHPQTDGQIERMNQELEQYLKFFINHREKDWLEWLVSAEFAVNNKAHLTIKVSLFIANDSRKIRIGDYLRRKEKVEKAREVIERIKKV